MIERERESNAIRAPSAGRTIRYRSRDRGITFRTIVVSIICEQSSKRERSAQQLDERAFDPPSSNLHHRNGNRTAQS